VKRRAGGRYRSAARQEQLEALTSWRNAIAHQDWTRVGGRPELLLRTVAGWRSNCRALAVAFDRAVGDYLAGQAGSQPW
jgi:hypothetical protein